MARFKWIRLAICVALCFMGVGTAFATLVDRGGGLLYDTVLDVTWLQDANYAYTSGYSTAFGGRMNWSQATDWTANLSYYDTVRNDVLTGWRLPKVGPVDGSNFNYVFSADGSTDIGWRNRSPNSELSYMYYVNLGLQGCPGLIVNYVNVGPPGSLGVIPTQGCGPNQTATSIDGAVVHDLVNFGYWFGTASDSSGNSSHLGPAYAWWFAMFEGLQDDDVPKLTPPSDTQNLFYAWAVRDGDVGGHIPEPGTLALLAFGLAGVGYSRRRKPA